MPHQYRALARSMAPVHREAMRDVGIVTVIHDSAAEVGPLLTSIERFLQPRPEVVVVDSGSSDDGAEIAREHGAEVVTLSGNLGFGAGCNAGLERVRAPVAAFVNPDVELLDDGLRSLVVEATAREALVVPRLLNPDGSVQDSAHPRPGTLEALIPAVLPRPLMPGPVRRRYEPWRSSERRIVGWAIAACLVARTQLLRRLGPFDPAAFLFYEDLDLCLRAADLGIPTLLCPSVAVRHRGGASVERALAGTALELEARRRREVMARRGRLTLALDDAAQALTFGTRGAFRTLLRRGGAYDRAQVRALRAARRAGRQALGS
jgi:N-acetylglucosaminyl-diphospho-decaprenol L-rhamnosyltransferase